MRSAPHASNSTSSSCATGFGTSAGDTGAQPHLNWIRAQQFPHDAQQRVLEDHLRTVEETKERVERLTKSIIELVETWSLRPLVVGLQALRGISTIAAVTIAAEIGDFARFASAPQFMSFTGLVPSEHSSGEARRQGRITRCGNRHVRRILVESAWSYRFQPRMSPVIQMRAARASAEVRRIAWRAQHRLCGRYRKLMAAGKPKNKVIVGVARELAGFVWAVAREPNLVAGS
jgi:transposase